MEENKEEVSATGISFSVLFDQSINYEGCRAPTVGE